MSLPSLDCLKDQANRLTVYMGDKHRMRLKASSALEAIAALYKQRDWNTLQALARRADGESAQAAGAASPTPQMGQYPLTWQGGRVGYAVSENDWFRHTLVCGGYPHARRTWLQQQLMAHLARNGVGVFINAFGGTLPLASARAVLARGCRTDLDKPVVLDLDRTMESSMAVNLLAGLEPSAVAELLLSVLEPGADPCLQAANYVFTVLAEVLQQMGAPVTLAAMLTPWRGDGRELRALLSRANSESQAHQRLASLRTRDDGAFEVIGSLGGVVDRLSALAAEPWAAVLFSSGATAPSLSDLLNQGRCVLIEGAGQDGPTAGKAEQLLTYAIREAMHARFKLPYEARQSGWVVGFGELAAYLSPAMVQTVTRARAGRIALLMTAANQQALATQPYGQGVLANTGNQLYLGGLADAKIEELAHALRTAPVALCQPGSVQWSA